MDTGQTREWIETINRAGGGDYMDYALAEAATPGWPGYVRAVRTNLERAAFEASKSNPAREYIDMYYYRAECAYRNAVRND